MNHYIRDTSIQVYIIGVSIENYIQGKEHNCIALVGPRRIPSYTFVMSRLSYRFLRRCFKWTIMFSVTLCIYD